MAPPRIHATTTGPGSWSLSATLAGTRKMPLPMVDPTSTAMALQSPRCRGRRSPQASAAGCECIAKCSLDKGLPQAVLSHVGFPGRISGGSVPLKKSTERDRTGLLRRLAWAGSGFALGLIVLGGIVRITGSGMGCGDHWPRCNGEWFPPLDLPTLIESSHRWAAAVVSLLVLGVAAVALKRHRTEPALRKPAVLAAVLLVVQVLLGAVTVKLDL